MGDGKLPKVFPMPKTAADQKKAAHMNRMVRWSQMVEAGQDKSWTQVAIDEELQKAEGLVYSQ